MIIMDDYNNFVKRMGSFDDVLEMEYKNKVDDFIAHFNPFHDKSGRFTSSSTATSNTTKTGTGNKTKTKTKTKTEDMSDEDLASFIKRKTLEQKYDKLHDVVEENNIGKTKKVVDNTSNAINQLKKMSKELDPEPQMKEMDLSGMTDKEMRDKINRTLLERQYTNMFGEMEEPQISKGKQRFDTILEAAGSVLAVGSSALAIAVAVNDLKKK